MSDDQGAVLVCTPCTIPASPNIPIAGTIECDICGVDCWISATSREAFRRHDEIGVWCMVCALEKGMEMEVHDLLPEQEEELRANGIDPERARLILRIINGSPDLKQLGGDG